MDTTWCDFEYLTEFFVLLDKDGIAKCDVRLLIDKSMISRLLV